MKLSPPFEISSRLMASVRIGGATLSLGYSDKYTPDNRTIYEVWIDLPDGSEHAVTDLHSGCGGGGIQSGMAALVGFLCAAGESYDANPEEAGENADLFPPVIVEWASQNQDELACLSCELDEGVNLVEE